MTRVLVVEDEKNLREPLVFLLQREGYDVIEAEDGNAALDNFRLHGADLVLLDLMLPGLSGNEVCRAIRAESSVPVIMVPQRTPKLTRLLDLKSEPMTTSPSLTPPENYLRE